MSLCHFVTIGLGGGGARANLDNVTKYEVFFFKASLSGYSPPPLSVSSFLFAQVTVFVLYLQDVAKNYGVNIMLVQPEPV